MRTPSGVLMFEKDRGQRPSFCGWRFAHAAARGGAACNGATVWMMRWRYRFTRTRYSTGENARQVVSVYRDCGPSMGPMLASGALVRLVYTRIQ